MLEREVYHATLDEVVRKSKKHAMGVDKEFEGL